MEVTLRWSTDPKVKLIPMVTCLLSPKVKTKKLDPSVNEDLDAPPRKRQKKTKMKQFRITKSKNLLDSVLLDLASIG